MEHHDLKKLNAAAELLISQPSFHATIEQLRSELRRSNEPFAWTVVDPGTLGAELPASIKSSWVFVLKGGTPSGCHYHPNSVQHMVAVRGRGTSRVGGVEKSMATLGSAGCSLEDIWFVIAEGVPHEFFPVGEDLVVVSFHTCRADELAEIACDTGATRHYE